MKRAVVLCIATLALAAHVPEASAIRIIGAGNDSCGTWTKERRENKKSNWYQTSSWVLGYLRGTFDALNLKPDPMESLPSGTGGDAVDGWLDKYCAENPLADIYEASGVLAIELIRRSRR